MKHDLLNKVSAITKVAYVSHCPGHKNSKGELAEWCVKSHETDKIISSHTSEAAAKKHLQDMHAHSGSRKSAAISNRGWFEVTHNGNDFQCPYCGVGLTDEEWNTEYGDKLGGDYEVICPDCDKPFIVGIEVSTQYRAKPKQGSRKTAFGYYNFEWQGNNVLLIGPDKETILLSGKPAREFQEELEHIEEATPSSEALEQRVNEYIAGFFSDWREPTEEELAQA